MRKNETIFAPKYGNGQSIAYDSTAGTIATAFPKSTTAVWAWTTTDAYLKVAASPTATSTDFPIPAYTPVVLELNAYPNEGVSQVKVSAIRITANGTLYVCPIV